MKPEHQITLMPVMIFTAVLLSLGSCSANKKTGDVKGDSDDTSSTTDTGSDSGADTQDTATEEATFAIQNQTVFAEDKLLTYEITIHPDDLNDLDEHGNEEEYKSATLRVVGDGVDQTFDQVGVRYKGAWSLHHCWDDFDGVRSYDGSCARLSVKLKFNKYDDKARLYGLKRLNLHSMMGDASKLRDRLSYSLFNDFGVAAPRTAHARLIVNGVISGLYIAVENVDGRFTHYHFPEGGDGNLYKEIWPSPTVDEDWALAQLRTNDDPENNPDVSDFLQFKDLIAQTTPDDFKSSMPGVLNLDNLVRYLAVDRAIKNWDGIMGFYAAETSHNFYWYHDNGPSNLFHLVPWDLDNTIQEFDIYMDPGGWCDALPVPDWNETPLNCDPRKVCTAEEPLITPPRCDHFVDMLAQTQWNEFVAVGNELLQNVFSYDNTNAKITAWASQIEETIAEDPLVDENQWQSDVAALRAAMKNAIADFQEHLDEGLTEEIAIEHLDESTLTVPIEAGPLRPDIINNFEFESGTEDELTSSMYPYASEGTDISLQWHTDSPILGDGDLMITAAFASTPGGWSEWAIVYFATPAPIDITKYQRMWFSARSAQNAQMRMEFNSPAYQEYGNIYESFCQDFSLTTDPQYFYINLSDLLYPQWARDAWPEGDGWDKSDSEVRNEVLSSFNGLGIQLFPTVDLSGEMTTDTEQIVVQIDNIYFE